MPTVGGYTTTFDSNDVLGTDPMPWIQFSSAGAYTASTGVQLVGADFQMNIPSLLTTTAVVAADTVPFFSTTATAHRARTFTSLIADLQLVTQGNFGALVTSGPGIGIAGSTISLNTTTLTTGTIDPTDTLPFFDVLSTADRKATFASMISSLSILTTADIPASEQAELAAIDALGVGTGYMVRTGDATFALRTITGAVAGQEGIVVTNGNGVAGNSTIGINITGLTADLTLAATDEFIYWNGTNNRKIDRNSLATQLAGFSGALLAVNNLSDLTNVATARTNLGLVAGGAGDIWVEKAGDTMTGNLVMDTAAQIQLDGSAVLPTAPALTFDNDLDTGFYRSAANTISATVGGVETARFLATGIEVTRANTLTPQVDLVYTDTVAPVLGTLLGTVDFNGPNSTLTRTLYGRISVRVVDSVAATEDAQMDFNVVRNGGNNTALTLIGGVARVETIGTAAFPAWSFITDPNTGVFSPAADILGLSAGGTEAARFQFGAGVNASTIFTSTDAVQLPNGSTVQRPTTPVNGMLRYNSTLARMEGYINGSWSVLLDSVGTGFLVAANNLSDVANVATARTNLGLVAGGAGDIWVEKAGDTMIGDLTMDTAARVLLDGSVTTPGLPPLTFDTDLDTGFYRPGANLISLSVGTGGGPREALRAGNALLSTNADEAIGVLRLERTGTAGNHETGRIAFRGINTTPGTTDYAQIRQLIIDNTTATATGSLQFNLFSAGANVNHMTLQGGQVRVPSGTAAIPGVSFLADVATGVYRPAANSIGLSVAGVGTLTGTTTAVNVLPGGVSTAVFNTTTITLSPTGTTVATFQAGGLANASVIIGSTDAITMPRGTTVQRPTTPVNGMFRYNSTLNRFEGYENGAWQQIGTTGSGFLVAANNLSDVANAATARTNLGLVAGGAGDIWVEKAGDTMTGSLTMPLGAVATPSINFTGATTTGLYAPAVNQIGVAISGAQTMLFQAGGLTNASFIFNTTDAVQLPDGTTAQRPATPVNGMLRYNTTLGQFEGYENGSWEQVSTTGTGFLLAANNLSDLTNVTSAIVNLGLNPGGTNDIWVEKAGDTMTGNLTISGTAVISHQSGTPALPSYTFTGDTDTGMYRPAANIVGFAAGGNRIGYFSDIQSVTERLNNTPQHSLRRTGTAIAPATLTDIGYYDTEYPNSAGTNTTGARLRTQVVDSTAGLEQTAMSMIIDSAALGFVEALRATGGTVNAQVQITSGSVTAPSLAFLSDTDTGMYLPGAGQIGYSNNGSLSMLLLAGGLFKFTPDNAVVIAARRTGTTVASGLLSVFDSEGLNSASANVLYTRILSEIQSSTAAALRSSMKFQLVDAGTVVSDKLTLISTATGASVVFTGTDAVQQIVGTTAQRPTAPVEGMYRYNSTLDQFEGYANGSWQQVLTNVSATGPFVLKAGDTMTGDLIMSGAAVIQNTFGTAALPSYAFSGDTDTGMYTTGAGNVDISANGARAFNVQANTATVISTTAVPTINVSRGTPVATNSVGQFRVIGNNVVYGAIDVISSTITAAAEVGALNINLMDAGTLRAVAQARPDAFTVIRPNNITQIITQRTGANMTVAGSVGTFDTYFPNSAGNSTIASRILTTVDDPTAGVGLSSSHIEIALQEPGGGFVNQVLIFPNQIQIPPGTVAAPSYSFIGDSDTGLYEVIANTIGVAVGGVRQQQISAGAWYNFSQSAAYLYRYRREGAAMVAAGTIATNEFEYPNSAGTNVANAIRVLYSVDDPTAGLDTTNIAFQTRVAGTLRTMAVLRNNQIEGSTLGTAAAPTFTFTGDTDMGMYRAGANVLGWSTAGVAQMSLNAGNLLPAVTNVQNLGSNALRWNTMFGEATSALYADLAERYEADADYPEGTILVIGGDKEVTTTTRKGHHAVAGLVSMNPAVRMNDGEDKADWPFIALAGRVPARVVGKIAKGDRLGTSHLAGCDTSLEGAPIEPGAVVAIAMQSYDGEAEGMIEVMVRSA